jgi:hypothetical protein
VSQSVAYFGSQQLFAGKFMAAAQAPTPALWPRWLRLVSLLSRSDAGKMILTCSTYFERGKS